MFKETSRTTEQVLDFATHFFGLDGYGLSMSDRTRQAVAFVGDGGWICVCVDPGGRHRTVEVESRRMEQPVSVFLRAV